MKHIWLLNILILVSTSLYGKIPVSEMNDCEFFTYLKVLEVNEYVNIEYDNVKKDFTVRSNLLRRLEEYMLVHEGYNIAPIYLDYSTNIRVCTTIVNEYEFILKKSNRKAALKFIRSNQFANIRFLLLDLCDLNKSDNACVTKYLAEFKSFYTLEFIFYDHK